DVGRRGLVGRPGLLLGQRIALVRVALLALHTVPGIALGGVLFGRLLLGLLAALGRNDAADLGIARRIGRRDTRVVPAIGCGRQRARRRRLAVDTRSRVQLVARAVAEQPTTAGQQAKRGYAQQAQPEPAPAPFCLPVSPHRLHLRVKLTR